MIDTVLAHEAHLFGPSELELLHRIKSISCEDVFTGNRNLSYPLWILGVQQFILARLVQRKRGKWHRADHLSLNYTQDLIQYMKIPEADVPGTMLEALIGLCTTWRIGECLPLGPHNDKEVIDLTLDSDDDEPREVTPLEDTTVDTSSAVVSDPTEPRSFAEDTASASPTQLLECLTGDELKLMTKRLKVPSKTKQTRSEMIKAILRSSSTQTTLPFTSATKLSAVTSHKSKNDVKKLFQAKRGNVVKAMPLQERRVRDMCNEIFGACFRLHDEVFRILHLVNVVYFRRYCPPSTRYIVFLLPTLCCSTQYSESESILLSAILATSRKRNFPKYTYLRTPDVFKTRADMLRYMECLQLLGRIDDVLGQGPSRPPSGVKFDRLEAAQEVIQLWKEKWDRWNSLVTYSKDKPPCERGLERFEEGEPDKIFIIVTRLLIHFLGHVLTRAVYKAAYCFGLLKDYEMELKLRAALLRQTRWRRGRRGGWYDRMALVYMRHMGGGDANLNKARDILLEGLNDKLVHLGMLRISTHI